MSRKPSVRRKLEDERLARAQSRALVDALRDRRRRGGTRRCCCARRSSTCRRSHDWLAGSPHRARRPGPVGSRRARALTRARSSGAMLRDVGCSYVIVGPFGTADSVRARRRARGARNFAPRRGRACADSVRRGNAGGARSRSTRTGGRATAVGSARRLPASRRLPRPWLPTSRSGRSARAGRRRRAGAGSACDSSAHRSRREMLQSPPN